VSEVTTPRAEDEGARAEAFKALDLVPDAVWVVDADTSAIEYANPGAAELLGYAREELQGMTLMELSPGSSHRRRADFLRWHLAEGPEHRHEVEVVRRARSGEEIPCDSRGQLVVGDDGSARFVLVDRDARARRAEGRRQARREALGALVAELSRMLLAKEPDAQVYRRIVDGAAELLDSENASLVLHDPAADRFVTVAARGPAASLHASGRVALDRGTVARWAESEEPFAVDAPPEVIAEELRALVGPGAVARFPGPGEVRGILTAFRARGREPFEADDVATIGELSLQAAAAIALSAARSAQHHLALLEERQRIARDLHDIVVQDLIGIALQLGLRRHAGADAADDDLLIDQIDSVVRRLRTIVFDARNPSRQGPVSEVVRATAREAARSLGHEPSVRLVGPVDALPPAVVDQLVPSLREALSNVARHAGATRTEVVVEAGPSTVELTVDDDGGGLVDGVGGLGLGNLEERAKLLGGRSCLERRARGTRLTWSGRFASLAEPPLF
jgi:PAS domain S-box-containing protein